MYTLNKKEQSEYELSSLITTLRIELRNVQEWSDKAKDTLDFMQDLMLTIKEKKGDRYERAL